MGREKLALWGRRALWACALLCVMFWGTETLPAQGDPESCSASFWASQPNEWCATGFQPSDDHCAPGAATLFVDAFALVDLTAAPTGFDPSLTLHGALSLSGSPALDAMAAGAASLLSSSHPSILYPIDPAITAQLMRDAFAGSETFPFALQVYTAWNSVEAFGGCPLSCPDQTPPTITCDATITRECGDPEPAPPTVSDDQDPDPTVTFSDTVEYGSCLFETTVTRTWTATDDCGNTATATQTIITVDTTPPALTVPGDLTLSCYDPSSSSYSPSTSSSGTGTATALDACDTYPLITFTDDVTIGSCPGDLTVTRTWTATDACGNASSGTQTITYTDETAPSLSIPDDVTVSCTVDCHNPASPVGTATASDDCAGAIDLSYTDDVTAGSCPAEQLITRTWTATDICGNSASGVQLITVIDDEAPAISAPGDLTLSCADPLPLAGSASVADGCDPDPTLEVTEETFPGDCAFSSTIVRTFTATDACGNTATSTQTITIVDDQAPALYCPVSITLDCGTDPSAIPFPEAIDDCDPTPLVTFTDDLDEGDCEQESTLTRTWTATDACGNSSTMVQTIHFQDTTAPTITCPPLETLPCGMSLDALPPALAIDDCDPTPTIEVTDEEIPGTCPGQSLVVRTWTATDDCGNSSSCTQSIFFLDSTAPVIECPPDATLSCDDDSNTGNATATDDCDPFPVVLHSDTITQNGCEHSYTIARTWTAIDGCGNESSCVQLITYVDDTAPEIVCPPNLEIDCTVDISSLMGTTASDDCDPDPALTHDDVMVPGPCPQSFTIERTYTAVDDCGNTSTRLQTITVTDETAPLLDAPGDITLSCTEPLSAAGEASATDECDPAPSVTSSDEVEGGDCPQESTITRTWSATDACGNTATVIQVITIVDDAAPLLSIPADQTLDCTDAQADTGTATAIDDCDPAPAVSSSDEIVPGNCPQEWTILRTWTATDACGNSSSALQTITIADETAPALECLPLVELDCTDDLASIPYATATDDCDSDPVVTHTDDITPGNCPQSYTISRTYTATDACGNSSTRGQTIEVTDQTAPVIDCALDVALDCSEDLSSVAPANAIDDCDPSPSITSSDDLQPGPCPQSYTIVRTWTATDACGNESTHTQTITVTDETAPVIECLDVVELDCTEDLSSVALATALDDCDPDPEVTHTDETTPGDCPQAYTVTRTFTATDACGNSSTRTQTIIVTDENAPFLEGIEFFSIDCTEDPAGLPGPTVSDDCDGAPSLTSEDSTAPGSCPQESTITRTWTALDACGNESTFVQTITITDETAPVLSCTPTVTLDCSESLSSVALATALDDCDPDPSVTFTDLTTPGACPEEYTIERTFTATDACGNSSSLVQTITVVDDAAPELSCPADLTIGCHESSSPSATGSASATDACDPYPSVTYTDLVEPGSCFQESTILRTWTATDACGNSTSCTQTIQIVDTLPPVIDCPSDQEVDCDDLATQSTGYASADDLCDPAPAITFADETIPGSCPFSYTILRTWTATDECGNASSCVQTLTVVDDEEPEIACPPDVTLSCENSGSDTGTATATDSCDPAPAITFTDSMTPGACPQAMTIVRTWTATDACGNSESCEQVITIVDETPPVIECPADITVSCLADSIPMEFPTASDGCDSVLGIRYTDSLVPGNCPQEYTILRTWKAMDDCGNFSTCTQTISIVDDNNPELDVPADITLSCTDDLSLAGMASASDPCGGEVSIAIDSTTTPGDCPQESTITRTFTAIDSCGNTSTGIQVITIVDDVAPEISVTATVALDCTDDLSSVPTASASDNCDGSPSLTHEDELEPGPCPQSYTIVRTWTATDACGNASNATQTITVTDDTAPVISCLSTVDLDCTDDFASVPYATATDDCDDAPSVTHEDETQPGPCPQSYTIVRTYTATDACGNSSTQTQTITVTDETDPVITGIESVSLDCSDDLSSVPAPTATDDCDDAPSLTHEDDLDPGDCPQEYTIERTYTATDACGNSTTWTQTITVTDETAPIIDCAEDIALDCADMLAEVPLANATDDCDPSPSLTHEDDITPGSCPQSYTVHRVYTATDACGNSSTHTQTITVTDSDAPLIDCVPEVEISCSEDLSSVPLATAVDLCDPSPSLTFTDATEPGSCPQEFTVTRTFTATDACGNSSTRTQTITVRDEVAPSISGGEDTDLDCTDDLSSVAPATATDDCDPSPSLTHEDEIEPGPCPQSFSIVRTYTATDACGNSSTHTQTITVTDETAPVIECLEEVALDCTDDLSSVPAATALDDCDADPELTHEDETFPGSCPQSYTIVRTYTATDDCGNSSTRTQTITVTDETDPVITGVEFVSLDCTDDLSSVPAPSASDDCDSSPSLTFEDDLDAGDCPQEYTIERTYTATDACGNSTNWTQTIVVTDENAPVIDCATDVALDCTDDLSSVVPATATDDCDPSPSLTHDNETLPGPCPQSYTIVRTYTATDACGNESTHTQTITVTDETAPVLECLAEVDLDCADDLSSIPYATATDDCDSSPSIAHDDAIEPGACPQSYTITRTYTATDACGNSSTRTQTITVTDETAPVIDCADDVSIDCADMLAGVSLASATDDCDPNPSLTHEDEMQPGPCPQSYTLERTYTATDACGNSSTHTQTITVTDSEAPFIDCLEEVEISCSDDLSSVPLATAVDLCDPSPSLTFTDMTEPGDCPQESTITRTFTATDACGNSSTRTQTITIRDEVAPLISGGEDTDLDCTDDLSSVPGASASDDCDASPSLTFEDETLPGPCPQSYTIVRTYTATDACENESTHTQTINVTDTTAPVIDCLEEVELDCTDDFSSVPYATASDDCDSAPSVTHEDDLQPGSCPQSYTVTRTFTATDACGNVSTRTQTITVTDETAPLITGVEFVDLDCSDDLSSVPAPSASDDCDASPSLTSTDDVDDGDCPQEYTITRTYTATDACGNSSTWTQTITVSDENAPVIDCATDVALDCSDDLSSVAPATATDDCDPSPSLTHEDEMQPGPCPQSYTIVRTYTATDACGNDSTHMQTITVTDETAPTISGDDFVDLDCSDDLSSVPAPTATDDCDDAPSLSHEDDTTPGACPQEYTIERTYTATDACGNSSTWTQTITVSDETAPVIDCADDVSLDCADMLADVSLAAATDDCDPSPSLTHEDEIEPGPCPQSYTVVRTYTATDACGNTSTHLQTITVTDSEAPFIECLEEVEISCSDDLSSVPLATAVDLCDPSPSLTFTDTTEPGDCPQESTVTRTFTATDACGNTATRTQTITIRDEVAPLISGGEDADFDCGDMQATIPEATATDDCDGSPTLTFDDEITDGSCPEEYTITRTWTATDACGNASTHVQTITVSDDTAPVIECLEEVELDCTDDLASAPYATASDDCDGNPTVTHDDETFIGACPQNVTVVRTYTATDACGNSSTRTQTITFTDETDPVIDCFSEVWLDCTEDPSGVPLAEATDDCDSSPSLTYTETMIPGSCANSYTLERTYTATDDCGNESTRTQTIHVTDDTAPAIECPPEVTIDCGEDLSSVAMASASDDCDPSPSLTFEDSTAPGTCPQQLVVTRTYTATDACGNTSTETQTIIVTDETAPVIDCLIDVTLDCGDSLSSVAPAIAIDDCDPDPGLTYDDEVSDGNCPQESTITRTWTATDACGNSATLVQTITIVDETAPTLSVPTDQTVEAGTDLSGLPGASASDDCDPDPSVTTDDETTPGSCDAEFVITRTATATDACGNESSASWTITVVDTTAPSIDCPYDVTIDCSDDPSDLSLTGEATAYDAGDSDPTITYTDEIDASSCSQLITRTWTATDDCGNSASCTQLITVTDSTPPMLTCPSDVTVSCTESLPDPGTATATDDCDSAPVVTYTDESATYSPTTGGWPWGGGGHGGHDDDDDDDPPSDPPSLCSTSSILRTWTATDACGNTSTCQQWIVVLDDEAPVLTGGDPVTLDCGQDPDDVAPPTAVDNCDPSPSIDYDDTVLTGDCDQTYTLVRTWTATDACGNESSLTQTIEVGDTTPPSIVGPGDTWVECGEPTDFPISVFDDCASTTFYCWHDTDTPEVVTLEPLGDYGVRATLSTTGSVTITCYALDECMNVSATHSFVISAQCDQACSKWFWYQNIDDWCETPFIPCDDHCAPGTIATEFLTAFQITDTSACPWFDSDTTLWEALVPNWGMFSHMLRQGTAALLNAEHPDVAFPVSAAQVRQVMQQAFDGTLTWRQAKQIFLQWNSCTGGCPLD